MKPSRTLWDLFFRDLTDRIDNPPPLYGRWILIRCGGCARIIGSGTTLAWNGDCASLPIPPACPTCGREFDDGITVARKLETDYLTVIAVGETAAEAERIWYA